MYDLSSDEEAPKDLSLTDRVDAKKVRQRIAALTKPKTKLDRASKLQLKRRIKKLVKKLRSQAID